MELKSSMHALPVFTLFLLSPALAEIITGSTPVTRFTDILPAIALYGSGAVLIRETAIRLNTGWLSVTGMGIAFGILEEAFALQSVFNPYFLGHDISFGRLAGVNWVWAVFIIFYHALFSIAIPVRITEFIFYPKSKIPWTNSLSLLAVTLLYLFMLIYYYRLFLGFTGFNTTAWRQVIAIILTILIVFSAVRFPQRTYAGFSEQKKAGGSVFTLILTLLWFLLFSIIFLENDGISPVLIMVSGIVVMAGLIIVLHRLQINGSPGSCISALMTCIVIEGLYGSLVLSVSGNKVDRLAQAVISMLVLSGLIWLKRKFKI